MKTRKEYERESLMVNLSRLGFTNIKKGAAHCLVSQEGIEVLSAWSWESYVEKCVRFMR